MVSAPSSAMFAVKRNLGTMSPVDGQRGEVAGAGEQSFRRPTDNSSSSNTTLLWSSREYVHLPEHQPTASSSIARSSPIMAQNTTPSVTPLSPQTFENLLQQVRYVSPHQRPAASTVTGPQASQSPVGLSRAQSIHHPLAEHLERVALHRAQELAAVGQPATSSSIARNAHALAARVRLSSQAPALPGLQPPRPHTDSSPSLQQPPNEAARQSCQQAAATPQNIRPTIPWSCPNSKMVEMVFNHDSSSRGAGVFLRTKAGFAYYMVRKMFVDKGDIFHVPEHLKTGLIMPRDQVVETYRYIYESWLETQFRRFKPEFDEYYIRGEEAESRFRNLVGRIGAAQEVLVRTRNAAEAKKALEAEPPKLPLDVPRRVQITRPQLPDLIAEVVKPYAKRRPGICIHTRLDIPFKPCMQAPAVFCVHIRDIEHPLAPGEVHALPPWAYFAPEDQNPPTERSTPTLSLLWVPLEYHPLPHDDNLTAEQYNEIFDKLFDYPEDRLLAHGKQKRTEDVEDDGASERYDSMTEAAME
ncbi:uncharacterized protein BDZ99DRAFT_576132 [Mytilinidion resinicola]|uniref:Uncharacterized protein n=1 Tax=Mytilinidion resinicola TaxID=574789 RepID=A0A6A6Y4E4_9PEZI|nr:uncharacterized protein BDZ99DRAFT_576132 [Mytilinidion resinicola]KAF2803662.1 hypothetical protein BDZ99DRAFT_576132 [Mytilinidion resinicola]